MQACVKLMLLDWSGEGDSVAVRNLMRKATSWRKPVGDKPTMPVGGRTNQLPMARKSQHQTSRPTCVVMDPYMC
eukprot:3150165-Alexandrium_andersonii.AAC.1